MARQVIRVSEVDAATTNVATLLAHVRAGAEVIIENDERPVAVAAILRDSSGPPALGI